MKISKIFTKTKCPYCGHENRHQFETDDYQTQTLVWCRANFGGCGRAYVVSMPNEITIDSKTFKIDDNDELKMPI